MVSINQEVWKLLASDIALQKNLQLGVTNVRALAKYIIKNAGLNASVDSVISAIRRYDIDPGLKQVDLDIAQSIQHSQVTTRTNVVCLTLKSSAKVLDRLAQLRLVSGGMYRLSEGTQYLKLAVDKSQLHEVLQVIPKGFLISTTEDLAEIIIFLSKSAISQRGVLARFTHELTLQGVNIVELFIAVPEMLFYVDSKNLVKAHDSFVQLTH